MDTNEAIKDLILVKQVFDKVEVPFFLSYGTALGAYRDKEFLPGDDDIDLGVTAQIDLKTRKKIGWLLYDLGFVPQDTGFNVFNRMEPSEVGYNGTDETGIIVCQKNVKFTIFFWGEEDCPTHGREKVCIPKLGAYKLIASPAKFYKKFDEIMFHGEKFLIPTPIEEYLAFTYENWKDPMARDHGKTYFEMHQDKFEMVKDVLKRNEVVLWKLKK